MNGAKHLGILLEAGKVNDIDTPEKNTPSMSTRGQRSCRNRKRKTLHDDFTGLDDSDEEQVVFFIYTNIDIISSQETLVTCITFAVATAHQKLTEHMCRINGFSVI